MHSIIAKVSCKVLQDCCLLLNVESFSLSSDPSVFDIDIFGKDLHVTLEKHGGLSVDEVTQRLKKCGFPSNRIVITKLFSENFQENVFFA